MLLPSGPSIRGRLRRSIPRFSGNPTHLPGAGFASIAKTDNRTRHSCIQKLKGVMPGDPARSHKAVVIRTRRKLKGHKELFAVAAVALVAYLVQPGDTLSGIAASHGAALAAVEAANPQISDPNRIYAGQTVEIPLGSSAAQRSDIQQSYRLGSYTAQGSSQGSLQRIASSDESSSSTATQSSSGESSGYSSSSLSDIPGVPAWFASCVAYRESTDLENPAADGDAYGIIPASGYNVYGTSLAHQKQVFAELYQEYGGTPWAADGCPGT
jgi:LysM repeat protein